MPRVGMIHRKTKRSSHSRHPRRTKRHSQRCIFRYKHTRKQHRKQRQQRQRGGVSDDLPTTQTLNGTPFVANDDIAETSVSVQGFGQITPKQYKKMAESGELVVDN